MYNALQATEGCLSGMNAAVGALVTVLQERRAEVSQELTAERYYQAVAREREADQRAAHAQRQTARAVNLAARFEAENRALRAQLAGRN